MTNKAGLQREQGGEGLLAGRAQLTAAIRTLVREGPGWVVACVPDRAGGWRTHLRPGESEGMEGKLDFSPGLCGGELALMLKFFTCMTF